MCKYKILNITSPITSYIYKMCKYITMVFVCVHQSEGISLDFPLHARLFPLGSKILVLKG